MSPTPSAVVVGGVVPPYPAGLYRFEAVAEDGVDGFAAVDAAAVERFHRDGYLVIRDAFTGREVAGALDEMLAPPADGTYTRARAI